MYAAGIDIGTTTISILLLDPDKKTLIGRRTMEHNSFCEGDAADSRLQDPEQIWSITRGALRELFAEYGKPDVIGLTGQMHGMLYVNAAGEAVSPLYTWEDGSGNRLLKNGQTCAELLKEQVGTAASGYGLTTHYYLQQTGRIPREAVKMTTISDYIAMKLTGNREPVIAADMAASWGCFDLERGTFSLDRLRAVGADVSYLPPVCASHCVIGRTAEGIPVVCSMGDNQASVAGTLQDLQDTLVLNIGTGSQVSMLTSAYLDCGTSGIELRPFPPENYLMVGAGLCGGRAYAMLEQFYREASGVPSGQMYDQMLRQGEQFLEKYGRDRAWRIFTTFSGTRTNPEACGRMEGIRVENFHPGAMTVGMIAGILEELYGYYERMCQISGQRAKRMAGSGNGLRRNALMQQLAEEIFGMPLQMAAFQEEAACGAAFCASGILNR